MKRFISHANLIIKPTQNPKPLLPNNQLVFGQSFTDHMLTIEWKNEWQHPTISTYKKLELDPSAQVFHYGVECFEGMKAYKDSQGNARLFRPEMNMARLLNSCKRLSLPEFNQKELLKCISSFVKQEIRWIPSERGYSLYLRPTAIATQNSLGVGPSNKALLFVIASPVGPYYKTGFNAVSLLADTRHVRAWPGGTGDAKVGGNYAPGIVPQIQAMKQGHQQILWLFGPEDHLTEGSLSNSVGTMNLFCHWINEAGENELLTAPLDGTILPGVTRDSIIQLTKQWGINTVEKKMTMNQLIKASQENRIIEMFGCGTAAVVSPIKRIQYKETMLDIPLDPKNPTQQAGPLAKKLWDTILAIQYGQMPHEWSFLVE
jgi:branched-chain amino acid aminotransferase